MIVACSNYCGNMAIKGDFDEFYGARQFDDGARETKSCDESLLGSAGTRVMASNLEGFS